MSVDAVVGAAVKRSPKAIGTAAESAVRMWLNDDGWPDCERRALTGNRDTGDLTVCRRPLIIAEVKAGHAADKASPKVIADWLEQTDTEAVHAGAWMRYALAPGVDIHLEQWADA